MWKPPECTVSGGFFLLVGWFALCCGWQTALTVLGAAAWHEFGHLLALRLCGGEARRLRVGMLGAVIEVRGAMGYGQELASTLAGPLANLLAAAVLGRMGCTTAAGAKWGAVRLQSAACPPAGRRTGAVSPAGVAGRSRNGGMGLPVGGHFHGAGGGVRDGVAGVAHGGKPLAAPCRSGIAVGRSGLAE